jgi:hypothetical protein
VGLSHEPRLIVEIIPIHKVNRKKSQKQEAKNIAEVAAKRGLNKK